MFTDEKSTDFQHNECPSAGIKLSRSKEKNARVRKQLMSFSKSKLLFNLRATVPNEWNLIEDEYLSASREYYFHGNYSLKN